MWEAAAEEEALKSFRNAFPFQSCMCKGTCQNNEQSRTVHKSGVLPVQACRRPQSFLRKLQRLSRRTGVNAHSTRPQAKCRSCCPPRSLRRGVDVHFAFRCRLVPVSSTSLSTADQWMDHSQSAVSRTSLSTACRMLRESVSRTILSTECLNAEPFTWGPQCLPCVESSNVWLHEVLTKGSGHPWTE